MVTKTSTNVFTFISHQGNAKQTLNKIPLHTHHVNYLLAARKVIPSYKSSSSMKQCHFTWHLQTLNAIVFISIANLMHKSENYCCFNLLMNYHRFYNCYICDMLARTWLNAYPFFHRLFIAANIVSPLFFTKKVGCVQGFGVPSSKHLLFQTPLLLGAPRDLVLPMK
jgi:hypothetical protein